jgi:cell wall assembly regulator SMI1
MEGALDLLARFPFPEAYCIAHPGAATRAVEAVEQKLSRTLPEEYKRFLLHHDGIENTWSRSGWMIRGCTSLSVEPLWATEILDFSELQAYGYTREEWWALLSREPRDEFDTEGWLEPTGMLLLGNDSSGDLFFLDTAVHGPQGHPVARFFHDVQGLRYVHPSLGAYLAWLNCRAHTHPQEWDERLSMLFPWPSMDAFDEGAESLRQRALAHLVALGVAD